MTSTQRNPADQPMGGHDGPSPHTSDASAWYQGEKARRSPATAAWLSFLMPGLGHIYTGSLVAGLLRSPVPVGSFGLLALAWHHSTFTPHLPLLVTTVAVGLFWFGTAKDAAQQANKQQNDYLLRSYNRPLVYFLMVLCLHAAPWLVLHRVVSGRLATIVKAGDAAMFPLVFKGDLVLVDRTAYRRKPPQPGNLVLVSHLGRRPRLRRVIAVEGQRVYLDPQGQVYIDEDPLLRHHLGHLSMPGDGDPESDSSDHLVAYMERAGMTLYPITFRPRGFRSSVDPVDVEPGRMFLLGDNRDNSIDSRHTGTVPLSAIIGRPVTVAWSVHPMTGNHRPRRAGLELQ